MARLVGVRVARAVEERPAAGGRGHVVVDLSRQRLVARFAAARQRVEQRGAGAQRSAAVLRVGHQQSAGIAGEQKVEGGRQFRLPIFHLMHRPAVLPGGEGEGARVGGQLALRQPLHLPAAPAPQRVAL